jgi:glycosyltransferase involved in cell wall biosynthesis
MKKKIAIVRGKFLNAYEMQIFEPLSKKYDMTAFGSKTSYHKQFTFPTIQLPSPMDIPDFPYKMSLLNRVFIDAHHLYGLEERLKGFDIVHSAETYFNYTQQAINAREKGYVKKVVATILENIPFNNEGIWGRKYFKKRTREKLDHMIALTKRTRDTLILEGADPKKITVISHGIDTKRFTPSKGWLQKEKDKSAFTILFSGRLEAYKGVYEILYAAKLLLTDSDLKKYSVQFVFVGEGSEKEKLLELEKKLGIKKFVTHRNVAYSAMPQEYQKADIFCAPSKPTTTYQEQYCTALLEAQAAGLPIVTTFSGGIPENIGNAGLVVGPGDFYSLKEALKQFILSPKLRIEYGRKARNRAEAVHDTRVIANQLDNLYKTLL